jgi:phosphatidylglycerophosphate synthase
MPPVTNDLHWTDLLSRRFDSPNQAFFVRWVSQPVGAMVAALAYRSGLGPNVVTICGLLIMLLACVPYAIGTTTGAWLLAGLLWQLGFAFDCADGKLARATGRSGPFGAWLDAACDHVRQSAQALAIGYVLLGASLPVALSGLCTFVLLAGMSVYLHTAIFMNVGSPQAINTGAFRMWIRAVLRTLIDTPVFLLLICILRPWPMLLGLSSLGYGLLLLVRAYAIGRLRLLA